jgi:hypothetical protein
MVQLTGKHGKGFPLTFTSNFKRAAATAASRDIRVRDLKPGAGQTVRKINGRAREIVCAIGVDQYLDAVLFDAMISLLCLVELHPILHPGATARFNENTEPLFAVLRVFRDKIVQSSKSRVCHSDHCFLQLSDTLAESQRQGRFAVHRSPFTVHRSPAAFTGGVHRRRSGGDPLVVERNAFSSPISNTSLNWHVVDVFGLKCAAALTAPAER